MFNVRISPAFNLLSIVILLSALYSCSGAGNSYNRQAENLYSQAADAFDRGDYSLSLQLIDSIDSAYSRAIETRRLCRILKPQVIERYAAREISRIDSLRAIGSWHGDSLRALLVWQPNPVEGYWVSTKSKGISVGSTPGLHCRVSPDYHFYITACSPSTVEMTYVELQAAGHSVSSARVGRDGERNSASEAGEIITFTEAESDPLAKFIIENQDGEINIVFRSDNGVTRTMKLSEQQRIALIDCYRFTQAVRNDRALALKQEQLNGQLLAARRQLATVADTTSRR